MRTLLAVIMFAVVSVFSLTAVAEDGKYRLGAGAQYDVVTGDGDNGYGAYVYYNLDLVPPLGVMIDLSYVTGDYTVSSVAGNAYPDDGMRTGDSLSYSIIELGIALVFRGEWGEWSPYIGAGAANNFNDFEAANYDDQLSMFVLGGTSVAINESLRADFSVRYRTLQPEAVDSTVGEIDMDAYTCRAGIVFDF